MPRKSSLIEKSVADFTGEAAAYSLLEESVLHKEKRSMYRAVALPQGKHGPALPREASREVDLIVMPLLPCKDLGSYPNPAPLLHMALVPQALTKDCHHLSNKSRSHRSSLSQATSAPRVLCS